MKLEGEKVIYQDSDFSFVENEEKEVDSIARPSVSFWKEAFVKLINKKLAVIGLVFIILITLCAIFVPWFSKYDYATNNLLATNEWPSAEHWFGTDHLGRDIFVRVMYGARYSLVIGFAASILNLFIGIVYGGIAGFVGGKVDNLMMRIVDVIYSIPMTNICNLAYGYI